MVDWQLFEATIEGTSDLLMHNVRLANPMNEYARKLQELNKAKKIKGADKDAVVEEMARQEWMGGLYWTQETGPYLPAANIHKAILEAARMTREGKGIEQGVLQLQRVFPLEYEGPRDLDGMWAQAARFVDQRMVVVGQAKVLRSRPKFGPGWKARIGFSLNPEVVDPARFRSFVDKAGLYKGVCDGREGVMAFGRFKVVS
jgi:hypothetical protein